MYFQVRYRTENYRKDMETYGQGNIQPTSAFGCTSCPNDQLAMNSNVNFSASMCYLFGNYLRDLCCYHFIKKIINEYMIHGSFVGSNRHYNRHL